jgi:hypothetical protein
MDLGRAEDKKKIYKILVNKKYIIAYIKMENIIEKKVIEKKVIEKVIKPVLKCQGNCNECNDKKCFSI